MSLHQLPAAVLNPHSGPLGFCALLSAWTGPGLANLRGALGALSALALVRLLQGTPCQGQGSCTGWLWALPLTTETPCCYPGGKPNRSTRSLPPQTSQFLFSQIRFLPPR